MKKESTQKRKYTTITIPAPLFEKIQKSIKNTGFSSVSDYVTYVIRELMAEMESGKGKKGGSSESVIEKLRALGYVQ